ncbi:PIN domain-containing protein [Paractinoplanes hotanensis]|uniref:PIN domain-containing protein n=1 Tax=Paractinoplanes hotanensis TaxID=2906497 RepID=A0ABT0XZP7_9ACTN|nr:PIN domain-containing protein [Actinoplanes hotanensis]MCM4079266.1 PIN domain-containing protein [Actinoplanes hotanensis]
MLVRLVDGADGEAAYRALVEADQALTRIRAHGTDGEYFHEYSRWAVDQARLLRSQIRLQHVEQLIFTPRHTVLQSLQYGAPHLRLLTSAEIEERHSALAGAATELRRELDSWTDAGALIVPDTNVFLRHREKFDEIPWTGLAGAGGPVTVVVPVVILGELDRQKYAGRKDQLRWRASYSLSRIDTLYGDKTVAGERPELNAAGPVRLRVVADRLGHRPLERADDEIIDQALAVRERSGRLVTLATFDTNMAFSARQTGLRVVKLAEADLNDDFKAPKP